MAGKEQDREDLLAEATALVERVALHVAGCDDDIVAGFRRDGSASLYFGPARVYQFNSVGQLRRAYSGEHLIKAERTKLVALRRRRTEQAVELVRHDLDARETRDFFERMRADLEALQVALNADRFDVIGQVPEAVDVVGRVRAWLAEFAGRVTIARSPRVG